MEEPLLSPPSRTPPAPPPPPLPPPPPPPPPSVPATCFGRLLWVIRGPPKVAAQPSPAAAAAEGLRMFLLGKRKQQDEQGEEGKDDATASWWEGSGSESDQSQLVFYDEEELRERGARAIIAVAAALACWEATDRERLLSRLVGLQERLRTNQEHRRSELKSAERHMALAISGNSLVLQHLVREAETDLNIAGEESVLSLPERIQRASTGLQLRKDLTKYGRLGGKAGSPSRRPRPLLSAWRRSDYGLLDDPLPLPSVPAPDNVPHFLTVAAVNQEASSLTAKPVTPAFYSLPRMSPTGVRPSGVRFNLPGEAHPVLRVVLRHPEWKDGDDKVALVKELIGVTAELRWLPGGRLLVEASDPACSLPRLLAGAEEAGCEVWNGEGELLTTYLGEDSDTSDGEVTDPPARSVLVSCADPCATFTSVRDIFRSKGIRTLSVHPVATSRYRVNFARWIDIQTLKSICAEHHMSLLGPGMNGRLY